MQKLLIAESSDALFGALARRLELDFQLMITQDGMATLQALQSFQPDALILDFFLPYKDGLNVLAESSFKPPVIIGLTPYLNDYTVYRAAMLNVQYIMRIPVNTNALCLRLRELLQDAPPPTPESQVATLLHLLNFHTHLDGYRQLCLGIPIFAENPSMRLSKELYPAISHLLKIPDPRTVEHSIRKSISHAWSHRDPEIWSQYFKEQAAPPTNKEFISCLAEHIRHAVPECHTALR